MIIDIVIEDYSGVATAYNDRIIFDEKVSYFTDLNQLVIKGSGSEDRVEFQLDKNKYGDDNRFAGEFILTVANSDLKLNFENQFSTVRLQIYDRRFRPIFKPSFSTSRFDCKFFAEEFVREPWNYFEDRLRLASATKKEIKNIISSSQIQYQFSHTPSHLVIVEDRKKLQNK